MRIVTYSMSVSLDGYIVGPDARPPEARRGRLGGRTAPRCGGW
jgi:hypothetical protein